MTNRDIIRVCLQNLMRRKARTLLTVLGVLIGCCSIVTMVSMGIGMKKSQEKMLQEMGDLTTITVSAPDKKGDKNQLDAQTLEKIEKISGVAYATPKMTSGGLQERKNNISFKIYAGNNKRYSSEYVSFAGMKKEAIENLGYKLTEGEEAFGKKENAVLVGQSLAYAFEDSMRAPGSNQVDYYSDAGLGFGPDGNPIPPEPFFDVFKTSMQLEIKAGEGDSARTMVVALTPTGRVKEDYAKGEETSQGIIMDLEDLEKIMAKAQKELGVRFGDNKNYSSILVKAGDIESVPVVEKQMKRMGLNTSSMESIREPMEKEAKQKQMMLGGLGAISLFVAAIGIMNTMIMSISERTREIGIMKSLGCHLKDIRTIFLMEAGVIGFIGGVGGCIISKTASVIINMVSVGNQISITPVWLMGFGIVFSIGVGLGSGIYPAGKAVQIPAIEAMKHD